MRWRGPAAIVNDRPNLSLERMLYKDYDRRCSFENKNLALSLKGPGTKTNCLAVNSQSYRNCDSDSLVRNHENEHVRDIGQGEARHRKYKRLKLGGGQAYDRSGD
jgi:hypothetical protein